MTTASWDRPVSRLHRLNILYDRRFDVEASGNEHYTLKLSYDSSHTAALGTVRAGARVMDIGCGSGDFDRPRRGQAIRAY